MSQADTRRELTWFVVESQDRWYRAVCRFSPALSGRRESVRIVRVVPASLASFVSRVKGARGNTIIVWALASEPYSVSDVRDTSDEFGKRQGPSWSESLDFIASIRSESPQALQVAALGPKAAAEVVLAAREAGIAVFLESIESLPRLEKPMQRHFDPLG